MIYTELQKRDARSAVAIAIRAGRLQRLPCEVCRDPRSEAHHPDYGKPLEVRWLCKAHHCEEHVRDGRCYVTHYSVKHHPILEKETLSAYELPDLVFALAQEHKSDRSFAEYLGISYQLLCDILKRRRRVSAKMLKRLGIEQITVYQRTK